MLANRRTVDLVSLLLGKAFPGLLDLGVPPVTWFTSCTRSLSLFTLYSYLNSRLISILVFSSSDEETLMGLKRYGLYSVRIVDVSLRIRYTYLSIYLFIYRCKYLSIYITIFIYLHIYTSVYLCISISLFIFIPVQLSIILCLPLSFFIYFPSLSFSVSLFCFVSLSLFPSLSIWLSLFVSPSPFFFSFSISLFLSLSLSVSPLCVLLYQQMTLAIKAHTEAGDEYCNLELIPWNKQSQNGSQVFEIRNDGTICNKTYRSSRKGKNLN